MKLIDVTNSYPHLVTKQLENTDTTLVKVYTLGKTTVIYTEAPKHIEIIFLNKTRKIKPKEVDTVVHYLITEPVDNFELDTIEMDGLVEITFPVMEKQEV